MKNLKFISMMVLGFALLVGSLLVSRSAYAVDEVLQVKNFTVLNQGGVVGYSAGFSLTGNASLNEAQSIVVRLYSGDTVLQTNMAIRGKLTGNEFLTPFDVFGTFDYQKDGYFVNIKASEYGRVLAPTKVTATVVLADGAIATATNTKLNGDTLSIGVAPILGQVLGAEAFNFTLKIQNGTKGNEVIELQKFLNNSGYDIGVDGSFGPKTESALIKFQVASGLEGDGVVGPLTRAVLNN